VALADVTVSALALGITAAATVIEYCAVVTVALVTLCPEAGVCESLKVQV
jgi:hypothetical protein